MVCKEVMKRGKTSGGDGMRKKNYFFETPLWYPMGETETCVFLGSV